MRVRLIQRVFLLLVILTTAQNHLHSQSVQWAKRGVSQGYDYGNAIAVDDSGNAYISGQIEYTTNFDGVSLTTFGIHDILAGKFGSDGSIRWLRHAGGTAGDVAYGVGVDASHNCYVSGEVEQTASFGSGFSVTSSGSNDIFLAKYDINGNVSRLQRWGSAGNDKSRALAVTPSGECYLTGYYSDGMSFGSTTLSHAGGNDVYVAKVSSAGSVQWVKRGGGTNDDRGYGIAYDKSGNVFVTGYYNTSATFSGTTLSNSGFNSAYTVKYDANGNFKWIKSGGSCCDDAEGNCIRVDENNFIYSAGYFKGTATFGSYTLTASGSADIFIVKYDQSGNVVWAKSAGGPYEDIAYGMTIDTNNHRVLLTGQIDDYGYFGSIYVGAAGNRDVFIAEYDYDGNVYRVKAYGGTDRDIGYAIANDKSGNVYTTGIYNGNATFDTYLLNGNLLFDFFVEKTSAFPAQQPTVQSTSLLLSNQNCTDLSLSFTPGNGSRRLIIAKAGSAVSSLPVDGVNYVSSNVFGQGDQIGNGNYVVYDGTGSTLILSGLTSGETYYFKVIEYNGYGNAVNYLTTSAPVASSVAGSVHVLVNALSNEICSGDSLQLTAQGAATYLWTPSGGLSSIVGNTVFAFPAGNTTYTVTGTDAQGCQAQSSISITVHPLPLVTFAGLSSVCEDANPVTLSSGSPAGGTYSGAGVISGIFYPSMSGAGTFSLLYEYTDVYGCSSSAGSGITVNALPQVIIGPIAPMCIDATPVILNSASPSGGLFSGQGVNGNIFDPSMAGAGVTMISYLYTDQNGCTNSAQTGVIVRALPVILINTIQNVCENGLPVTLNNASPYGGVYSGTGVLAGVFNPSIGIGNYWVNYFFTDSFGCSNVDSFLISVMQKPGVYLGADTLICAGNSIQLNAGIGFADYLWTDGSTNFNVVLDSSGIGLATAGFSVLVTGQNGCTNSDTINITFDLCAEIEDQIVGTDILLYPNPFNETITLTSGSKITFFVFNSDGSLIGFREGFSGEVILGADYSSGVYLIEILYKGERKLYRIVKSGM